MYINKNKHIVSSFLLIASLVKILMTMGNALTRFLLTRSDVEIAILNEKIESISFGISIAQIIIITSVFVFCIKKIQHIRNIIPKEEYEEIALLQKEMAVDSVSVLRIEQIDHLLKLWGFVLIVIQLVYDLSTTVYERMILGILKIVLMSGVDYDIFVGVYNSSHGFKYICMVSAIMMGIFVSGLFLEDKILIWSSLAMLIVFMCAFMFVNSSALHMLGRNMEIVWTSVLFHALETVGLFITGIYLRIRYKGM